MTCAEIRANLSAFVDYALPTAQQAEVAAHVQGCTACAREVAVLQQTVEQLQQLRVTDTPDLLPGVRRKLSARPAWQGITLPEFHLPMPALALATSLMLVVIAIRVVPWRQELRDYQAPAYAPAGIDGAKPVAQSKELSEKDQFRTNDYKVIIGDRSNSSAIELPIGQERAGEHLFQKAKRGSVELLQSTNTRVGLEENETSREGHDLGFSAPYGVEEGGRSMNLGISGSSTWHADADGGQSVDELAKEKLDARSDTTPELIMLSGWLEESGASQKPMPPFSLEAQADVVALGTIGEPFTAQGQQLVGLVLENVLKGQAIAAPLVTADAMPFLGCILPARLPRPSEVFAPGTPVVVYLTQREGQWRILALEPRLSPDQATRQQRFLTLLAFLKDKVSPAETLQWSRDADDIEYAALLWALDAARSTHR